MHRYSTRNAPKCNTVSYTLTPIYSYEVTRCLATKTFAALAVSHRIGTAVHQNGHYQWRVTWTEEEALRTTHFASWSRTHHTHHTRTDVAAALPATAPLTIRAGQFGLGATNGNCGAKRASSASVGKKTGFSGWFDAS